MDTTITRSQVEFRAGDKLAGIYRVDDPFKPHFKVLNTPAGHNTVCVSPGDHRHHKGLMFALRSSDLNFWEENPDTEECGIEEVLTTEAIECGMKQELLWRGEKGDLHTYLESREITGVLEGAAFKWTWKSKRTALRDHLLIKSEWSMEVPDGRRINYHGLGIRLPWMWCFGGPQAGQVEVDGKPADPLEAAGCHAKSVGFKGLIDGQWKRTEAAVTITQSKDYTWYVLRDGFPYLSVGPSNLSEVDVKKGETFEETYRITVEDR